MQYVATHRVNTNVQALIDIAEGYQAFFAVVHPDDRQALMDAVGRSLDERAPLEMEYRVARPPGGWRWILSMGRLGSARGDSEARLHGVSINVTRRKALEERFRRVVAAAPVGMMILKPDGTIDVVNAWVESAFGHASQDLAGKPIGTLIPELAGVLDLSDCPDVGNRLAICSYNFAASAVRFCCK